jgi:hypothetical protein
MTLLSWQTALLVGAIAVPLLILLYFLKLRRREQVVPSTLLWKRAVQDLQVNAPFQKLRRNLLLFLQLLVLAAILFALAGPVMNFTRQPQRSIVLLVDCSGSMKTIEPDGRPRLEHAKDAAAQFVSNLPDQSRAMVISFADRANVVCTFTDDKRRLERMIADIEPTDASSKIGEALQLAVAYSTSLVEEKGGGVPQAAQQGSADIELFSDGRIADADQQFVTRGNMRYYKIGQADDNVGIVGFDVRRQFDQPGMLSIFVEVENFGPGPVKTDLSILLDGKPLPGPGSVKEISLGPAVVTTSPAGERRDASDQPTRQTVIFEMQHEAGGVIEAKLHRDDTLEIDNHAFAPVDPPREVRVLAVTDRVEIRHFLSDGFQDSLEIKDFKLMSSKEYDAAPDSALVVEGRSAFDLVVFDLHGTNRLPPGNYLFFGGLPHVEGISYGEPDIENGVLAVWSENHPLLRNVHLESVYVAKWKRLLLPEHAAKLVEGEDSAVMALVTDPGHRYLVIAFDLLDSDFPMEYAFPMFLQNTVMYLCSGGLLKESRLLHPGETIALQVPPGAQAVRIERPDGGEENLDANGRQAVTYARTHEAGVYKARFDDRSKTVEISAANLLDPLESLVRPNDAFTVGTEKVASVGGDGKVNEALWPWAVAVALLVLLFEWWVYNRRVMI